MVILEACVAAIHPHVHSIMFEAMCEYTALINKNHAVQQRGVTVVPCQQASADTHPVGFLGWRQQVLEDHLAVPQFRRNTVRSNTYLLICNVEFCLDITEVLTLLDSLRDRCKKFMLYHRLTPDVEMVIIPRAEYIGNCQCRWIRYLVWAPSLWRVVKSTPGGDGPKPTFCKDLWLLHEVCLLFWEHIIEVANLHLQKLACLVKVDCPSSERAYDSTYC
jgi:hypothetical protein